MVIKFIIVAIIAYLLGSISTGLILARICGGPNLREVGSKNTGASNVLRTMGLKSGLITFLGDAGKAALSCGIGWWITGTIYGAMLAGLFVILGHNWPVFFQFKGGKGVASSCGVMVVCFPIPALICFVITIALIYFTRYISLGSMTMLTLYGIIVSVQHNSDPYIIAWCAVLAVLCILRHRANIKRLMNGTENKLGQKVK
ncbi:MAG: glycerol-3-phosphate 1-O-acyltransferase PlsY [Clostridia bacterium]|nr:glycerol-3-phosphate 1-O-acyltransferase PlsY [Clostridia bacterium]